MRPEAVLLDQGNTYRCGAFSVRQWFEGYGFVVATTKTWATYTGLADSQQGLAFSQVHDMVSELAAELGIDVTWLGDGYLRDFPTFDQSVRDRWCDVVGVLESDLNPGQGYYHYLSVDGLDGTTFDVKDPYHLHDGEDGPVSVEQLHAGIRDNWDASLIGVAWQMRPALAQAVSQPAPHLAPLEALLREIGAESYQVPQNEHTVRMQVLVQQALRLQGYPV